MGKFYPRNKLDELRNKQFYVMPKETFEIEKIENKYKNKIVKLKAENKALKLSLEIIKNYIKIYQNRFTFK